MDTFKDYSAMRREQRRRGSSRIRALPPFVVVSTSRPSIFIPETNSHYSGMTELTTGEHSVSLSPGNQFSAHPSIKPTGTQLIRNEPTRSRSIRNEPTRNQHIRNEPFRVQSSLETPQPERIISKRPLLDSTEHTRVTSRPISSSQPLQTTVIREHHTEAGTLLVPTTIVSPAASVASNTGMLTPERMNSPVRSVYTSHSNTSLQERQMEFVVDTQDMQDTEASHSIHQSRTPSPAQSPARSTASTSISLPVEPNTAMDVIEQDIDMERDLSPQARSDDEMDIVKDEEISIRALVTNEKENTPIVQDRGQSVAKEIEENVSIVDEAVEPAEEPRLTHNGMDGLEAMVDEAKEPELVNNEMDGFETMADEADEPAEEPGLTHSAMDVVEAMVDEAENPTEEPRLTPNVMGRSEAMVEHGLTHNEMDGFEAIANEDMYDINDNNFDEFETEQKSVREQEQEQVVEEEGDENGITEEEILAEMNAMEVSFRKSPKYTRLSKFGLLHIEALEKACYGPMREARNFTQDPLVRSVIEDFYSRLMNTFDGYSDNYQAYIEANASIHHIGNTSKKINSERLTAVASTMELEKRIEETNKQIELLQSKIEASDTIENYLVTVRNLVQPPKDD